VPRGRPTLLTDELLERIVALVKLGNYPSIAAKACGISESTFADWMGRGRLIDGGPVPARYEGRGRKSQAVAIDGILRPDIYSRLVQEVQAAEGHVEAKTVASVVVAAETNDKTAVTFLERRFPKRWGAHAAVEISGADGGPIKQEVETTGSEPPLSETLTAILEALSRAGKLPG